jgi:hypothetical protein
MARTRSFFPLWNVPGAVAPVGYFHCLVYVRRIVFRRMHVATHVGAESLRTEEIGIGACERRISSIDTDTFYVETPAP